MTANVSHTPATPPSSDASDSYRMTAAERRASFSLSGLYALRMLGLFIVLPVFALQAAHYPGGDDPAMVGLAMGAYGLTQACLHLAFGAASDRWGRKRVIVGGLLIFIAGSLVAAMAQSITGLIVGRMLQGAGAVSAVISALLADQTRPEVRTKALAMVGASSGLMFALSLVLAPPLAAVAGLPGLFVLTAALAVLGIWLLLRRVPPEPPRLTTQANAGMRALLTHGPTLRLNAGVFIMHAMLLALWVAVPGMLVQAGLAPAAHWQVYLPAMVASFGVMAVTLFPLERRGYTRAVFLCAIGVVALVLLGLAWAASAGVGAITLGVLLFAFFCCSNILEACQPSIASRAAPPNARGAAMGFYNTLQSLGFFAGGAVGGLLMRQLGAVGLFVTLAGFTLLWLLLAWPMAPLGARGEVQDAATAPAPRA